MDPGGVHFLLLLAVAVAASAAPLSKNTGGLGGWPPMLLLWLVLDLGHHTAGQPCHFGQPAVWGVQTFDGVGHHLDYPD